MTDAARYPHLTVVPHPAGLTALLTTAEGQALPVQTHEPDSEEMVLVVLTDVPSEVPDGVDPATLEYTTARGIVRLHGEAMFEPQSLVRFVADGDPEVIQRRAFVRVHTPQPVTLVGDLARGSQPVYTIDLSGGGMLLSSTPSLRIGDEIAFEIALSDDAPLITGVARVVREQADGRRALAFEQIGEPERQRLIHFVFSLMRESRAKTRGDHF